MNIGGYQIIDFEGIEVKDGLYIPGMYEKFTVPNKPIMIRNLHVKQDGIDVNFLPFFPVIQNASTINFLITLNVGENFTKIRIGIRKSGSFVVLTEKG